MQKTIIDASSRWMIISYDFDRYIVEKGYDGLAGDLRQAMKQQLSKDPTLESVCDAVEACVRNDDDFVDWLVTKGVERTNLDLVRRAVITFAMYLVEKSP